MFHRLHGDDLRWRGISGIDQANAHLFGLPWLEHQLSKGRPLLPLEQVDSGDRVVKVFCKVFERSESSDRADFELALAA